jgi:hypothetical protein
VKTLEPNNGRKVSPMTNPCPEVTTITGYKKITMQGISTKRSSSRTIQRHYLLTATKRGM